MAIKIQYPGVAKSINSDLNNLKRLMNYTGAFPKTMFLDKLIQSSREELAEECDYEIEASKQKKYAELIKNVKGVKVPKINDELSTKEILTMEFVRGVDLDYCQNLEKETRQAIGHKIMELTLREIFEWRFMQTDPNPTNFLYNPVSEQIYLLDFGAAREFSFEFCQAYLETFIAAYKNDRKGIIEATKKLGFLSGEESETMLDAHVGSILTVAEPLRSEGKFDFENQDMTAKVYKLMPVMLKNRLQAPPPEVYSLHRKLSGAYLVNMKLKTQIDSNKIFKDILRRVESKYKVDTTGVF